MRKRRAKSHKRKNPRRRKHAFKARRKTSRKRSTARKNPRRRKHARKARRTVARATRRRNPKRRKHSRKSRRVARRRNPSIKGALKNVFAVRTLARYAAIGGGIALGSFISKFLNTGAVPFMDAPAVAPSWVSTLAKARPVHGLLHILAGSMLAAKAKNKYVQDVGIGLAALGGFDLLMQGLALAGVKGLPTFSGMNVNLMGRSRVYAPGMAGMNVNLMGDDNSSGSYDSDYLSDNINDMIS